MTLILFMGALAWLSLGCEDDGDDDAADDDAADDDTGDDDTGDDDTGDDDTGDDDSADDDVDPETVIGQVYLLDLGGDSFNYTEPPGAGGVLATFLPDTEGVIFTATAIDEDAGTLELRLGSARVSNPEDDPEIWEWVQIATPTTTTPGTWANPAFEGGPTELNMAAGESTAWLGDTIFGGLYAADASEINGVYLEALVDMVPFDLMLGFDPGTLCATIENLAQVPCVTCPPESPDQGDYCLFIAADSGICPLLEGFELQEVL